MNLVDVTLSAEQLASLKRGVPITVKRPLVTLRIHPPLQLVPKLPMLTDKQAQAAQLIASGMSRKEAAHIMGIDYHTVDSHVQKAYRRLGVHGRFMLRVALEQYLKERAC